MAAMIRKEEKEMYAEVGKRMRQGRTFDEAWIDCGGQIIPLTIEDLK